MNKKPWFIPAKALLIFLYFLCFSKAGLTSPVVNGPVANAVDEYLSRIVPYGFSGAVLVAKDDRVILNQGYGMAIRANNIPNTETTVLNTGSITKQFTAAAIMKLEMQGKLNTSDAIGKFFEQVPADKKNITLHHLLTHTSGIVDAVGDDYVVAKRHETITRILQEPLQFTPGEEFSYSNAGYSLLAAVIEKVSGQDYEQFLNEQLFKPTGMHFTGYRIPQWNERVVAHWYVGEKDNGTPLEKPYPYWNVMGNGEILSTTADLYQWHLALKGDKIFSKEAKKKIFTPYLNDYGYGWDVLASDHGLLIQHDGGSGLGSSAEFRRYIDANVVTIIFCNQSYGGRALFNVIRDKLETLAFGGKVNIPPPSRGNTF
jgi:CubicO group peptidase (beta-lactamase class C family)